MAEKKDDLNAYCSGHISGVEGDARIALLPEDFVTEAAAFGGATGKTSGGFARVNYLFYDSLELRGLPALEEQPRITQLLECIEQVPKDKTLLLRVNGPYSILASLVEPALFYRWLAKKPEDVHAGLERITAGLGAYIGKAFSRGGCILSLADPYANADILGETHYCSFAGAWLMHLLKTLMSGSGGIIQLCPHNSPTLWRWSYTPPS